MQSRKIEAFRQRAADDPSGALAELRSSLEAAGGPLIERDAPTDRTLLITFVWIGAAKQVSVRGAQIFADRTAMSHPMQRIEGTEVWFLSVSADSDLTITYQYLVNDPFLELEGHDLESMMRLMVEAGRRSYADPFNSARLYPVAAVIAGDEGIGPEHWESVLELPDADRMSWFEEAGAPGGQLIEQRLQSDALAGERVVTVYLPPGYDTADTVHPLLVVLDGEGWLEVARLNLALDNLIAAGRVRAPIVAFVRNVATASATTGRMAELACNPALAAMLADELLPSLRRQYRIVEDASDVIVAGASLGGLAAAYVAFQRPGAFGAVVSSSGSHAWGYTDNPVAPTGWGGKDGEPEWLTRQYAATPKKPIRFWIDVGRLEVGTTPLAPGVDHRAANRHLRTVLIAKGYAVLYHESAGGHEFATFRKCLAKALQQLLPPRRGT